MLVLVWWGVASQLEGSEENDENLIKGGLSNGGGGGIPQVDISWFQEKKVERTQFFCKILLINP